MRDFIVLPATIVFPEVSFFSAIALGPTGLHRLNASDVGVSGSLRLARVERDGANISEGIELKAGEQVNGLKVVMT